MAATAKKAGLHIVIDETARFRWCAIGGGSDEPNAYMGCGDELWGSVQTATLTSAGLMATGEDNQWFAAFLPWASATFEAMSVFSSQPVNWYGATDPTGVKDNCRTGPYMGNLMANLGGNTATGIYWQQFMHPIAAPTITGVEVQ